MTGIVADRLRGAAGPRWRVYRAVELSGMGGYEPGHIRAINTKMLTTQDIAGIEAALAGAVTGHWRTRMM